MKVAVVTGSRADYGLLRPTIQALRDAPDFELALLVTAMHLEPEHGLTIQEIQADKHEITRVPITAGTSASGDISRRLGNATVVFTAALAAAEADFLLVLGDRFEMLAAALAATSLELPIVHLHGGELSEGSLDDSFRHCLTKLAHLHLVASREYGERVCQLGEEPWRVRVVGAAAIESIFGLELLDRETLAAELEIVRLEAPLIALTLHPASLRPDGAEYQAEAVVAGVTEVLSGRGTVVVTLPNDDPGSQPTRRVLLGWAELARDVHVFASLGQLRYLSLLRHADAIVGNSSSAILEAPSFALPAVNVGDRQRGRLMAANVISCPSDSRAIAEALRKALAPGFRVRLSGLVSPYGDGDVSRRVLEVLATAPDRERLREKRFLDLPDGPWRGALQFGTA